MIKLINFIESNLVEFNSLENSEVLELNINSVDSEIVDYLKSVFRNIYFYNNICVYYSDNLICVENICD